MKTAKKTKEPSGVIKQREDRISRISIMSCHRLTRELRREDWQLDKRDLSKINLGDLIVIRKRYRRWTAGFGQWKRSAMEIKGNTAATEK